MSRDCRAIRPMLGAFHDGELNRASEERVRQHLAVCAECRRELAELERLTGLVRQAGPPELAEDYWDWVGARVRRRLAEHDRRPRQQFYRPSFVWPKVATLAGALVVVLVIVLVGWQTMGPGLLRHRPAQRPELAQPNDRSRTESASEVTPLPEQMTEPADISKAGRVGRPTQEKGEREPLFAVRQEGERGSDVATVPEAAAEPGRVETESRVRVTGRDAPFRASPRSQPAATGLPTEPRPDVQSALAELPERLSAPPLPQVSTNDTGTVLVEIVTDDKGMVLAATVRRSSGIPLLDSLAVQHARATRFKLVGPARRQGASFEYPYRFVSKPPNAHE